MIKTFPIEKVQRLHRMAEKASEMYYDSPNGWSKSTVDPMAVLSMFEPLHIKEGFMLRAYQYREGANGNGCVWAMPLDADFPEPEDCPKLEERFLEPPKPVAALNDYMNAIDGDGTLWSYLCASILARELAEFGAMAHGCSWSTHGILWADPWQEPRSIEDAQPMSDESEWQWQEAKPKQWNPQVSESSEAIQVAFITYSGHDQETIYRHTDTYIPGAYRFTEEYQRIAVGPEGYWF